MYHSILQFIAGNLEDADEWISDLNNAINDEPEEADVNSIDISSDEELFESSELSLFNNKRYHYSTIRDK